jgi:multiple sugar transport system permease protein
MKSKFIYIFLLPACALVWIPLLMLFSGALTGAGEWREILSAEAIPPLGIPRYPTLAPLVELLLDTPAFCSMFWNTCRLVFPAVSGQVLVGAPAAWALSRMRFRGRRALSALYIALMLLPFQVTMVSNYLVLDRLSILDTHWSIILPGIFSPFAVFIMMRGFSGISGAILEAARIDGAGTLRVFASVGLPLGAPGVLSAVVLGFLEHWNMLEQPMTFLKTRSLWPLSLFAAPQTPQGMGPGFIAALVIAAPPLLLFLYGQQDLERGISAAGLKE